MGEEPDEVRRARAAATPARPSTASTPTTPAGDDPAQLRAEIARTRAEMAETIDAIQEKLSPPHLMQQAKDTVREAAVGKVKDVMTSATDTASQLASDAQDRAQDAVRHIRDNPLPAALAGAGLAWLMMRGGRREEPRHYYTAGPVGSSSGYGAAREHWESRGMRRPAQEDWGRTLSENPIPTALAGAGICWLLLNRSQASRMSPSSGSRMMREGSRMATDTARQMRDTVRDKVEDVTETMQDTWEDYSGRLETQFERWMRENPLTVGVAAVALGAAVGLAAPRTETEDRWLGEARDTLVERAQELAEGAVGQQAQTIVEDAAERVTGGRARGAGSTGA